MLSLIAGEKEWHRAKWAGRDRGHSNVSHIQQVLKDERAIIMFTFVAEKSITAMAEVVPGSQD